MPDDLSPEKNQIMQLYDPQRSEMGTETGCVSLKWEGFAVKCHMSYIS